MTHRLRVRGETNYFHVMSRGINKQEIFHVDEDYQDFITLIKIYSKKYNVGIISYCIMNNHFHILMYDSDNNKSEFIKCIKQVYSRYYNNKYHRIGTLFNDRYKDKPIFSEKYLLVVFRYILQNPEKSNIARLTEYPWSSYNEMQKNKTFLELKHITELCGGMKNLKEILGLNVEDYLSYFDDPIKDYELKEKLKSEFGFIDISILNHMDNKTRNKVIIFLKNEGMNVKSISKFVNLSAQNIYTICNKACPKK